MNKYKISSIFCLMVLCFGFFSGFSNSKIMTSFKTQTNNKVEEEKIVENLANNKNISSVDTQAGIKFIQEIISFIRTLNTNISVEEAKVLIAEKIYLVANSQDSAVVDYIAVNLLQELNKTYENTKSLVSSLITKLSSLISEVSNGLNGLILNYDKQVQIMSTTAALPTEAGSSYSAKLNGYIYYASGNSTKWVVLLHGYMMNGKLMAQALAKMYLNQGYNVLAPDLRGFGKSDGSVAMGYLESLDTWDWLTYINNSNSSGIGNRKASEVIIHGVSLGGATTLQTWTQVNFGRDLTTKNVIGLVDDCGYDSMTGIIKGMTSVDIGKELLKAITGKDNLYDIVGDNNVKNVLMNVIKVGIKANEFDLKQDSFYSGTLGSRKMSNVPLYIIHGTADTTVPFSISKNIVSVKAKQASLLYNFWEVPSMPHAFIIVGVQKDTYQANLASFIKYAENRVNTNNNDNKNETDKDKSEEKDKNNDKSSSNNKKDDKKETKQKKNFLEKIIEAIREFFEKLFG